MIKNINDTSVSLLLMTAWLLTCKKHNFHIQTKIVKQNFCKKIYALQNLLNIDSTMVIMGTSGLAKLQRIRQDVGKHLVLVI